MELKLLGNERDIQVLTVGWERTPGSESGLIDAKGESATILTKGPFYKVVGDYKKVFSLTKRFVRISLGLILTILSIGLLLCFQCVRSLFTQKFIERRLAVLTEVVFPGAATLIRASVSENPRLREEIPESRKGIPLSILEEKMGARDLSPPRQEPPDIPHSEGHSPSSSLQTVHQSSQQEVASFVPKESIFVSASVAPCHPLNHPAPLPTPIQPVSSAPASEAQQKALPKGISERPQLVPAIAQAASLVGQQSVASTVALSPEASPAANPPKLSGLAAPSMKAVKVPKPPIEPPKTVNSSSSSRVGEGDSSQALPYLVRLERDENGALATILGEDGEVKLWIYNNGSQVNGSQVKGIDHIFQNEDLIENLKEQIILTYKKYCEEQKSNDRSDDRFYLYDRDASCSTDKQKKAAYENFQGVDCDFIVTAEQLCKLIKKNKTFLRTYLLNERKQKGTSFCDPKIACIKEAFLQLKASGGQEVLDELFLGIDIRDLVDGYSIGTPRIVKEFYCSEFGRKYIQLVFSAVSLKNEVVARKIIEWVDPYSKSKYEVSGMNIETVLEVCFDLHPNFLKDKTIFEHIVSKYKLSLKLLHVFLRKRKELFSPEEKEHKQVIKRLIQSVIHKCTRDEKGEKNEVFYTQIREMIACAIVLGATIGLNCAENTHASSFLSDFEILYDYEAGMLARNSSKEHQKYINEAKKHIPFMQEMAYLLVCQGSKIPQKTGNRILADLKNPEKREEVEKYIPYLIRDGICTQEQIEILLAPPAISGSPEDLIQKAVEHAMYLKEALSIYHLNVALIPMNRIEEILRVKREIKALLSSSHLIDAMRAPLNDALTNLRAVIEPLKERHVLLHELRDIRRNENPTKVEEVSPRLFRLYALFSDCNRYDWREAQVKVFESLQNCASRKVFFRELFARVYRAAEGVFKEHTLMSHKLLWVHGTKGSSLPMCIRTKGLVPMGMLLEEGGVSFAGELCGSHEALNKEALSGEMLTNPWEEEGKKFYYNTATRFLVSYLYAAKTSGYGSESQYFDPIDALSRLTPEYLQKILDTNPLVMERRNPWGGTVVDILRIRYTDTTEETKEQLALYEAEVEKHLEKIEDEISKLTSSDTDQNWHGPRLKDQRKNLKQIQEALTRQITPLNEEEREKVMPRGTPYPVVFGSFTKDSTFEDEHCRRENVIKGKALFERDIQVAFTNPDFLEECRADLQSSGVRVYPMESAFYLEMDQMMRGSFHNRVKKEELVIRINQVLQRDVLPIYATPFPPNPRYKVNGIEQKLIGAWYGEHGMTYEVYLKKVKAGEIPCRGIHGPMHATRTAIWSLLLRNLYQKAGESDIPDPFLLAVSAGLHDTKREDESIDRWDEESGEYLFAYLRSLGYRTTEIAPFVQALKEKDPISGVFSTNAQRMVHDADVFEINRCLFNPKTQFDAKRLCCHNLTFPKEVNKEKLILQIQSVIAFTEEPEIRAFFEKRSDDCFTDFLRILRHMHDEREPIPDIMALLEKEIEALPPNPRVDRALSALCCSRGGASGSALSFFSPLR